MVFQASLVHAPDLNVTIAIFDYEKSGFDHMALRQKYDSIVRRLQERCQEQKVEMKISALVSDQESIYSKMSQSIPEALFDAPHLIKCFRNSFFNYLIRIDDALVNTRHLLDTCLRNHKNVRAVAIQDKMSVPHLCELISLRELIVEGSYLECSTFPCPIFSASQQQGIMSESIHFYEDSNFQFLLHEPKKLNFITNHGFGKCLKSVSLEKNIIQIAGVINEDVICVSDEGTILRLEKKNSYKAIEEKIRNVHICKAEVYNGNLYSLTKTGKIIGDDIPEFKHRVINIFGGKDFCVQFSEECHFPFAGNMVKRLPQTKNPILFIDSTYVVTTIEVYTWNQLDQPHKLTRPIVCARAFGKSICCITVEASLRIVSPASPIKKLLNAMDSFLHAFHVFDVEGFSTSQHQSDNPFETMNEVLENFKGRNGRQLSISQSTLQNIKTNIHNYSKYKELKQKYILTTLRTEHTFRKLRAYTNSIPTLMQCIQFFTRDLQTEILKHPSTHYLLNRVKPVMSKVDREVLKTFVSQWGISVRQKAVRTPRAPTGTMPLNTYFLKKAQKVWIPGETVVAVMGEGKSVWYCKTLAPIYPSSVRS